MNFTLKVAKIRKEKGDAVTLCFKQPGLKKVKYIPGQYLTLVFRINGRKFIRPYSFSSCPIVDEFLEVTIKRVPKGIVSNHINDVIKEGDSIEVMPPMGDFTFDNGKGFKTVYLWGVGSGITPLFSISKYLLSNFPDVKVILLYGNKSQDVAIFGEEIDALKNKYKEQLKVKHFHTQLIVDERIPDVIQGRIDQSKVLNIISSDTDIILSGHYICGPAGFKESIKSALDIRSVPSTNVFSEDFELIKDPADFEHIKTELVKVQFNGSKYEVEVPKGKSILEAALDADIELPYSCQTGNCSTCKGVLIEGQAKMIGLSNPRLDLKENEYLLCCSHPLSENVYFEI